MESIDITPFDTILYKPPQRSEEDWSYSNLRPAQTLWGPHGYHRYPAKFIPQLVRKIIDENSQPGDMIGDPFLGSATTGVEALRSGRMFWGSDINPVALLISQAKCSPLEPKSLDISWQKLEYVLGKVPTIGRRTLTEEEKREIISIDIAHASHDERMAYWFPKTYYYSLQMIFHHILEIQELRLRAFYLCAFSNILRNCSIWLSGSTKPQKDINKILGDPPVVFAKQCRDMIKRNRIYWDDITNNSIVSPNCFPERSSLHLADVKELPLQTGSLDLLVTSPPYATCYEYTELHQLTELWLNEYHMIGVDKWQKSCIGSRSCSQRNSSSQEKKTTNSQIADSVLNSLDIMAVEKKSNGVARDARALRRYFQDMYLTLKEFSRVVAPNKILALVIGNSYKRGLCIPTSDAITEMAVLHRFALERKITRKVPGRVLVSTRDRKTGRFSSIANSDTQVYPEEDILIFKRLS
jgi:DNA modification methylase